MTSICPQLSLVPALSGPSTTPALSENTQSARLHPDITGANHHTNSSNGGVGTGRKGSLGSPAPESKTIVENENVTNPNSSGSSQEKQCCETMSNSKQRWHAHVPFSRCTGNSSSFSTRFSSSYSAEAATGSTSSFLLSYSSLEYVLNTCGERSTRG